MENDGGAGTVGSHFEMTVHRYDVMIGAGIGSFS